MAQRWMRVQSSQPETLTGAREARYTATQQLSAEADTLPLTLSFISGDRDRGGRAPSFLRRGL
jgi:hypothetical protein